MRRRPFLLFPLALVACQNISSPTDAPPAPSSASAAASWPTPPPYDLDADVRLRRSLAAGHFFPSGSTFVQDDVFVLAAPDERILGDSIKLVHDALGALLSGRFSRIPSRARHRLRLRRRRGLRRALQRARRPRVRRVARPLDQGDARNHGRPGDGSDLARPRARASAARGGRGGRTGWAGRMGRAEVGARGHCLALRAPGRARRRDPR